MSSAAIPAVDRLNWLECLELALQSMLRSLRKLHTGQSPETPLAPTIESPSQSRDHAANLEMDAASKSEFRGESALDSHLAAAVKIDAAEYALTMMLTELRDVMATPPTVFRLSCPQPVTDQSSVVDFMNRAA